MMNEQISAGQILALLAASPLLESFGIRIADVKPSLIGSPTTRTPIQLPNLKKLELDCIDIGAVGKILQFIHAPNCEVFRLDVFRWTDEPLDATDFLSRSLGHFDTILRSILSFHDSSQLYLLQDQTQWFCQPPKEFDVHCFSIEIPIDSSIPWVADLLGQGVDPAHRLTVFFRDVNAENLAGLKRLSLHHNVQTLQVDFGQPSAVLILDLLGPPENEIGRSPGFPGLE
ncbi:hypothetical protein FRC01_009051, partial [Tulasnella sp. 417]